MKKLAIATAALALAAIPAHAQDEGGLSPEDQQRVIRDLNVLIGGLHSENVEPEAKSVLVSCIYDNSLKAISDQMATVMAENTQIDQTDMSQVLAVMVSICGYQPQQAPAAAASDTQPSGSDIERN